MIFMGNGSRSGSRTRLDHQQDSERRGSASLLSQHARFRRGSTPLPAELLLSTHSGTSTPLQLPLKPPRLTHLSEEQRNKYSKRRSSLATMALQEVKHLSERSTDFARSTLYPGRDSTLTAVYRQHKARNRIIESYRKVKFAMKDMQDKYVTSKDCRNPFVRYAELKHMIKEVTILEKQYWLLLELPKQDPSEQPNDYVNRILTYLDERIATEKSPDTITKQAPRGGIGSLLGSAASLAEKARETNMLESLRTKSTDELKKESEKLHTDIYKLIRKYTALRALVGELHTGYESSKSYPLVPRFSMLKTLIKDIVRAPAFADICHEQEE